MMKEKDVEYVAGLAKLVLSREEKIQSAKDMEKMLSYIRQLQEVDTDGVDALTHLFPVENVFREDRVAEEETFHDEFLKNAPVTEDGMLVVPGTLGDV